MVETPKHNNIEKVNEQWASEEAPKNSVHKKTIGEKIFNSIAYIGIADIAVFLSGIVVGYLFKFSSQTIPGSKALTGEKVSFNQGWKGLINKVAGKDASLGKKSMVDSVLMTTALMVPGNLALLPIKALESKKKQLVRHWNEKYGSPGTDTHPSDAQIGDWKIDAEPKQTWASLLPSRLIAWGAVFFTFVSAEKFFGNQMENFSNKTSNVFIKGAEKLDKNLSEKNRFRAEKFGKVAVLDFLATAAAAVILFVSSKFFAKATKENKKNRHEKIQTHTPDYVRKATPTVEVKPELETDTKIMPKKPQKAAIEPRNASYVEENTKRLAEAEQSTTQTQVGV